MAEAVKKRRKWNAKFGHEKMAHYINTYDKQAGYEKYRLETFVDDMLYGIGLALNPIEYSGAQGFDKFKEHLRYHLSK